MTGWFPQYERVGLSRDQEGSRALSQQEALESSPTKMIRDSYVAEEMEEGENPPIGLVLCSGKNETQVEYALGGLSNRIFVSRSLLHLLTQEELEAFVRRTRRRLEKEGMRRRDRT